MLIKTQRDIEIKGEYMNKFSGNLLYGQSGGPTPVINASAYGVIQQAKNSEAIKEIYCMKYGLEGFLNEKLFDVTKITDEQLEKLKVTPGAAFGSNRFKLKSIDDDEQIYKNLFKLFVKYNIRYFVYNGGNDSMDTIHKISEYAKKINFDIYCIGIPKTIDNDLPFCDHTPGFFSAANFIVNSVCDIYLDDMSYKKGRVNIVEIMGRDTGWLTASSIYAKRFGCEPDLIYVPEMSFDIDDFLKKVNEIYSKKGHCLVCVSEGIKDSNGNLLFSSETKDVFGHNQLGGVSIKLANIIEENLKFKTRYFELSTLQRANSAIPCLKDIQEAIVAGKEAVKACVNNKTDFMIVISKKYNNVAYDLVELELIANKVRYLEKQYIVDNGLISEKYINYLDEYLLTEKSDFLFL